MDFLQFPFLDTPRRRLPIASPIDQRAVDTLHAMLKDRFPLAFPRDYDALCPLKVGILADPIARMPGFDPVVLCRTLANPTRRDGYWLASIHGRGARRYDLDGQPAGIATGEERAEAAQRLAAAQHRQQEPAERVREHQARAENRRPQRAENQCNREEKVRRKAELERREQDIAARKVALAAQGLVPESRAEQQHRLAQASRPGFRPPAAPKPAFDCSPVAPALQPERPPERADPAPAPSMPPVEFRRKRRIVPPHVSSPEVAATPTTTDQ
jgi:sRNA-binding protein